MNRPLLVLLLLGGCTATVTTQPARPVPPPPPPAAVVVQPAAPAQHPAYLHALADLRGARGFLERPANAVVKWDEHQAIREIDAAIHEIKQAAIDDGNDISEHETTERTPPRPSRSIARPGAAGCSAPRSCSARRAPTSPRKKITRRARSTRCAAARSATSRTPSASCAMASRTRARWKRRHRRRRPPGIRRTCMR